ncbi:hypothetical protein EMPS_08593 [Entomortierella parvispora]|uniref:Uncharacterized protein n=1 Tax=Entomortierella parvispora TaxID=205924 RepID=A0A9P3HGA5_9FUNG|nr:hypothetical protein EMPS_08593 [Entomortierella parvispora]
MTHNTISTHTVKDGATTTIVTRTTTIVSEHREVLAEPKESVRGVVENVRQGLRDYWFPFHSSESDDDDDDAEEPESYQNPSLFHGKSVMRRAYDYWKTLTQDADEAAKELVVQAKAARDAAAAEAKWAYLGYKKEAREAFEVADQEYRDALAAAERVHEEAHEKAKRKWFQAVDKTEQEVGEIKDQASEVTHKKWDRFKAAVNSLAFNPPKYGCSPSSQYWFSRQNPSADSGWDCREIWDHRSRNSQGITIKSLPKKQLPIEKVHDTLTDLFHQAGKKAQSAPSATSFESSLKPVRDYFNNLLDRVARKEEGALEELDLMADKVKDKLNEAKFYEEQTDSWLSAQWNAVVHNAGDAKDQYERAFRNTVKNIQRSRAEAYNSLLNNLQKNVNLARNNVREAIRSTKTHADMSRVHQAIREATDSFTTTIRDADAKIKTAPKNIYDSAFETYSKDTAHLRAKLEHAASAASMSATSISHKVSKSGSSAAHQASKSGTSAIHQASKAGESVLHKVSKSASSASVHASKSVNSAIHRATEDAKNFVDDAEDAASSKYRSVTDSVRHGYEQASATASSVWSSATPLTHKVSGTYHKVIGDVKSQWFDQQDAGTLNISSVYVAALGIYFLFLVRRIWAARNVSRMTDPSQKLFTVVKNDHSRIDETNGSREAGVEKFKRKPATEASLEKERDSFGTIVAQFTSVVPLTLILLLLLELGGFSRLALHSLFVGLLTSQLLQGGLLNGTLTQMGIVDGVHVSGRDIGTYLSWSVLLIAAFANTVKVLGA